MPKGAVLVDWDNQYGPKVKALAPRNFDISKDAINKLLMSHSISKEKAPEIIELRIGDQIYISFCKKDKILQLGYSMLILVLSEDEQDYVESFRDILAKNGAEIYNFRGFKKIKAFKSFVKEIFAKRSSRKLLFIGPAAVGKSSIRNLFFEGKSSEDLLNHSLEPTYGLLHFNYDWMDLDLGVADLAGQEMQKYLDQKQETYLDPFNDVDIVLYIFDPSNWNENSDIILTQLQQIENILALRKLNSKIFIFCHKIDLINGMDLQVFQNDVLNSLPSEFEDSVFFTSIQSNLLYTLIYAMQHLISRLSPETSKIQDIILKILSQYLSTAVIIGTEQKLILETSTTNFSVINLELLRKYLMTITSFYKFFNRKIELIQVKSESLRSRFAQLDGLNNHWIYIMSESLSFEKLDELLQEIQFQILNFSSQNYTF
ncbi:MAG: GTPase [Promethearchaeota archaeon]